MTVCINLSQFIPRAPPGIFVTAGLVVLGILFGLDIATTEFILSNGGYEMNIIMQAVVSSHLFHTAVKLAVLLCVALSVIYCNSRLRYSGSFALLAIVSWYIFVVMHNVCEVLCFF